MFDSSIEFSECLALATDNNEHFEAQSDVIVMLDGSACPG